MQGREDFIKRIDAINEEVHELRNSAELDLGEAISTIKNNIEDAENVQHYEGLATAYRILSILYCYNGEASLAFDSITNAERICTERKLSDRILAEVFSTYVLYYYEVKNNLKLGAEFCSKGLKLARENNMHELVWKFTLNFGVICMELGMLEEALEFFLETLEEGTILNNQRTILYSYANIAEYYYKTHNIDKAREYHEKTNNLALELNDIIVLSSIASGFASIERELGNVEQSKTILKEAIKRLKRNKQKSWEANLSLKLIEYMIEDQEFEDIEEVIFHTKNLVLNINNDATMAKYYELTSKYYEINGDYKKALEKHKQYDKYHAKNMEKQESESINAVRAEMMQGTIKQLKVLSEVGREITLYSQIEDILSEVTKLVSSMFEDFNFILAVKEKNLIRCVYYSYLGKELEPFNIDIDDQTSFISYTVRNNETVIINDLEKEYERYVRRVQYVTDETRVPKSLLSIPLKVFDETIGVLQIQAYNKNMFTVENVEFFSIIASYTSVALRNSMHASELERTANQDSLTGLYNWHYFNQALFDKVINKKMKDSLSLIMMDIDHFKEVNDTYGHNVGNSCLKEVASRIAAYFDDIATVIARVGGEEFAVFLINIDKESINKRLCYLFEYFNKEMIRVEDKQLKVTLSAGVVYAESSKLSPDDLFEMADEALYEAKEDGRNRVVSYEICD
jgi:diguanylate cyclase (GGDEF)-like protein